MSAPAERAAGAATQKTGWIGRENARKSATISYRETISARALKSAACSALPYFDVKETTDPSGFNHLSVRAR